jgi:hypothetical protein
MKHGSQEMVRGLVWFEGCFQACNVGLLLLCLGLLFLFDSKIVTCHGDAGPVREL